MFEKDFDYGLNTAQKEAVVEVFQAMWRKKTAAMAQEMPLMARQGGVRRTLKFSDGNGGEVTMQVHPVSYHYWGQRLGYQCWQDKQFCREYLRDNPEARVRNVSAPRAVVQGNGGLAASGAKRFHKTYSNN